MPVARLTSRFPRSDLRLPQDADKLPARVARAVALAERTFANPDKAHGWKTGEVILNPQNPEHAERGEKDD